ncbi:hypothetical protein O3M35_007367 [Rhynocoris fuscipes]|uniref:Uncharacterized protein n=1 Tax=Rhynocoris fuscipes TaxID=488301 RepID=A0AAW1D968_9HEMI
MESKSPDESNASTSEGNAPGNIASLAAYVDRSGVQYLAKAFRNRKAETSLENADIYYIQQWFTKVSSVNKQRFILKLVGTISELSPLKLLLSILKPLTKDLYYSRAHCTKFSYDIVPQDTDRMLDESILHEQMEKDFEWLKTLNESKRCNIILDLIRMSGSAIAMKVLNETQTLADIYEFIDILQKKFVPDDLLKVQEIHSVFKESKLTKKTNFTKIISQDIANNKKIVPLVNMHKVCLTLKPNVTNNSKISELLKNVQSQEKLWDEKLRKLLYTIRTGEIEGKSKLRITQSGVEVNKFQLLPVWINRYILKYLDDESKKNMSQVDLYWKRMVEEEAKESNVRRELNKVIQKLEVKLLNTKLPGKRFTARVKKTKRPLSSKAAKNRKLNISKEIKKPQTADQADDLKESIFTFIKQTRLSRNPFFGLYKETFISTAYMYDRSISCSRKWIACTENTLVVFYNLITGEKTPFVISGHSLVVTCIAFFPNSFRLATGSLDKTIKTWDIWNSKELRTYIGHTDVIISLSVNENYIASCARDSTIRVFSQLTGVTIILVNYKTWTPTKLVLTTDNLIYWVNREGSLKMFSITDENINEEILIAHKSDITFLAKFGNLIITSGSDNFVRVWNANLINQRPLIEFYHEVTVSSAALSHSTIITACIDGCLRFWDVGQCKLFRTITINLSREPIIDICIQNCYNHLKILCNNELNITVIEFKIQPRKETSMKTNPFLGIMMHPIKYTGKLRCDVENRLIKLQRRKCTLPELRFNENYRITKDSIINKCINEKRLTETFPRYSKSINEYSDFGKIRKTVKPEARALKTSKTIMITNE